MQQIDSSITNTQIVPGNDYSDGRNVDILYSGRVISLTQGITESDEELHYRLMHSLVINNNPESVGMIDTFSVYGMQYKQEKGYNPDLSKTMIMRRVVQEAVFRPAIIKYIQKYVSADDATILRAIGRNNVDATVVQQLSQLPKRTRIGDDRVLNRVHTVTNLLSRIPHIPITHYLDYGTGDAKVAAALGDALSVPIGTDPIAQPGRKVLVQGVDVFPMERPVPTRIISDGDSLPEEWTNRFQLITAFVVFHHVKHQEQTLRDLYRVLTPGGVLILREHDYRDMTSPVVLRKQKRHLNEPQGITLDVDPLDYPFGSTDAYQGIYTLGGDPFRHFLDAIHIASMALSGEDTRTDCGGCIHTKDEPAFWSLYRARMEWHAMLQREGFIHMCTAAQGFSNISSQMEKRINLCTTHQQKPSSSGLATLDTIDTTGGDEEENPIEEDDCNGWISRNPQRLYEAVYSKPIPITQISTSSMILEYKVKRELTIEAFFPRKGGRTGEVPSIRSGINYDEEILAYMTPWHAAQQTSALISRLIRQEYTEEIATSNPEQSTRRKSPKFRIFDGTGGAGGNVLAFIANRDITSIQVYEKVPKFYNFLVNNVQLYTGQTAVPTGTQSSMGVTLTHMIAPPPPREGSTYQLQPFSQSVYMYNREFPLNELTAEIHSSRSGSRSRTQMTDSVLFLDVPWVSEGCGYKLRGYTYAGETLENVAISALQAGAYMVVLKLPPGYQLEVKHFVEELGKESLYVIYRRFLRTLNRNIRHQPQVTTTIRPISVPKVQNVRGGNPALELIRYRLMDHLRAQFRSLIPNTGRDDYYMWVYERIRTYGICGDNNNCVLDPVIPAVPTFAPSAMIAMEPFWPDMPFTQLAELIRREYPALMTQLQRTFFLDEQAVMSLRRAVASETSTRQREQVDKTMKDIDLIAREMHKLFIQASSIEGIGATVTIREIRSRRETTDTVSVVITPNQILQRVLSDIDNQLGSTGKYPTCGTVSQGFACMTLLASKLSDLRERYVNTNGTIQTGSFEQHLAAMLLRYSIMMEPTKETSFSGVNLHAAIPPALFRMIGQKLKVSTEAFASPLNATLRSFMSAFPDTDAPFGSIGSFFTYDFRNNTQNAIAPSGSYEANPPFTEDMIAAMMKQMEQLLNEADAKGTSLSFFIVVPNWASPPVDAIKKSKWKRYELVISASQHRFIGGQQHIQETSFTATFDTYIAILQSQTGTNAYPVPSDMNNLIFTSFT